MANPDLLAEVEAVFGSSSALRRARLVAAALEGARILWIDDNSDNNQWERSTLRQLGAELTAVDSTETALGCLRSEPFDLILSDVSRTGPLGSGSVRCIRDHQQARRVCFTWSWTSWNDAVFSRPGSSLLPAISYPGW